jgi:outer membrane protein assembly factor BamA
MVLYPVIALSQIIPSETADDKPGATDPRVGSYYSVFPLAGYTSDLGFLGGGFVQRINYGVHVLPFLSNTKADFTISTNGTIISKMQYERIQTFGTSIRSRIDFIGRKERQGRYYGIGNNAGFSSHLFDNDFYFFENREIYIKFQGRYNVGSFGNRGVIDLVGGGTVWYVNSKPLEELTLFETDTPHGFYKNWMNKLAFGVILDNRDSEFSPTKGIRYQADFSVSTPLVGSEFLFSGITTEFRHFLPLLADITIAHYLKAEQIFGTAPFWAQSIIGNEYGLRGYHLNRFRGDSSVLNILEMRSWLFSLFDNRLRLGAQVFWDTGRVFSKFDDNHLLNGWKHTFGAGGVISVFSPDFFVRGDLGISDESYRIYFGAGYIF